MASIVFVHGITVRAADYKLGCEQVRTALDEHARSDIELVKCLRGDKYGATLKAGGASIPAYLQTKGVSDDQTTELDGPDLWSLLVSDPQFELRLLGLRPTEIRGFDPLGEKTPAQLLDSRIQGYNSPSPKCAEAFQRASLNPSVLHDARQSVTSGKVYATALSTADADLDEFKITVARAIVASAVRLSESKSIVMDVAVYDEIVRHSVEDLGGQSKGGFGSWLANALGAAGTPYLRAHRGHYTDPVVPAVGDIIVYQGHGVEIRETIKTAIERAKPPVVILAHSLGGVASVDLLARQEMPTVELLITVGSQAPFFYEVDALQSLRFGESLPDQFPKWINLYDRRDFLSYIGAVVIQPLGRVEDISVDNRCAFPGAHSAYWKNERTWEVILAKIPKAAP